MAKGNQQENPKGEGSSWGRFYKLGAASALFIALLYLIEIVIVGIAGAPPTTVLGWFNLIHQNRALGILKLNALDIVSVAFLIPLFLALYGALKRVNQAYMALATVIGLIGVAAYFSGNTALTMLNLSDQYAAAAGNATQQATYLAMGQPLLSAAQSTSNYIGYLFNSLAIIIFSVIMLKSNSFSKAAAYIGIIANILLILPGPPTEIYSLSTTAYIALIGTGGVLLVIWYILIAKNLYDLGHLTKKTPP